MQLKNSSNKGYILLVCSAILASFFVLCFRQLTLTTSYVNTILLLYLFSFLYTIPWFLLNNSWKIKLNNKNWFFILLIVVFSLLGNFFIAIAYKYITPSVGQLLQRTDIFFGIIFGVILFKDKLNLKIILSLLITFLGLFLIYNDFFESNIPIFSMFAGILAAFCFALMQLFTKYIVSALNPNAINFWRLLVGSIVMFIIFKYNNVSISFTYNELLYGALAAFFGPFGARVLINYAIIYAPFSTINLFATLSPVITFFTQYLILGVTITTYELIGSILILIAVYLTTIYYR